MAPGQTKTTTKLKPIKFEKFFKLSDMGIDVDNPDNEITMESDRFVCVREPKQILIIEIDDLVTPIKMLIKMAVDSAIMSPTSRIIALQIGKTLQLYNMQVDAVMKQHTFAEDTVFWKWISEDTLASLTEKHVYHWSIEGDSDPSKMFERDSSIRDDDILDYCANAEQNSLLLIGNKSAQFYSVQEEKSRLMVGTSIACFARLKIKGNAEPSDLLCFIETKSDKQVELHVLECGQSPAKNEPFAEKVADVVAPSFHEGDFFKVMEFDSKHGLLYIVTDHGHCYLYDLESVTCVFRNVWKNKIFVCASHRASGGIIYLDRNGQVRTVSVDEDNLVLYVDVMLQKFELAMSIAVRNHKPSANSQLFLRHFDALIRDKRYEEAAKVAANAPNGIMRSAYTIEKLQDAPWTNNRTWPLIMYFNLLIEQGRIRDYEFLELYRAVLAATKERLEDALTEDKPSDFKSKLVDLVALADKTLAL